MLKLSKLKCEVTDLAGEGHEKDWLQSLAILGCLHLKCNFTIVDTERLFRLRQSGEGESSPG